MAIPLKFTTSLDDSKFMHGIGRMEKAAADFSKGLTVGAAGVTGIMAIGNAAIQAASAIADASAAANIGGEDFQRLSFALSQSGTKAEQFTVGLQTLTASIQEARDGNEKTITSFARLGISLDSIAKGDSKEILLQIADGMKDSTNKAESMSAALDLLGKGGKKMVAGLSEGRGAIEAIGESARVISERDLAILDKTGDRIARTWQGLKATVAGVVASAIRGPFGEGVKNPELESFNERMAEEAAAEREAADRAVERENEIAAAREKNWKRQMELEQFRYNAAKQAAKDEQDSVRANAEYASFEAKSQREATEQVRERTKILQEAAREATVAILGKAKDVAEGVLSTAQQRQQTAKDAADAALQSGVRGGLQTPAERRAEAMAAKRVAREERRLEGILADPSKKRGGKTGDAERAQALKDARREVDKATQLVALSDKSVKDITDAIEKLLPK